MKKYLFIFSLLSSITSLAININDNWKFTTDAYGYYKSSFVCRSGAVQDKNPVFQAGADTYLTYKTDTSLYFGVFYNHGTKTITEMYDTNYCMTDLEFYQGIIQKYGNWTLGLTYDLWYYGPNWICTDRTYQHMLHPRVSYNFAEYIPEKFGSVTLGYDPYFFLGRDIFDNIVEHHIYVSHNIKLINLFNKDLCFASKIGTVGKNKRGGLDRMASLYGKVALTYMGFELYYQHWFQLDDKVYTDWNYDRSHNCIGFGYNISF